MELRTHVPCSLALVAHSQLVFAVGLLYMCTAIILILIAMATIQRLCQRFHGDVPLMAKHGCGSGLVIMLWGQETHGFHMDYLRMYASTSPDYVSKVLYSPILIATCSTYIHNVTRNWALNELLHDGCHVICSSSFSPPVCVGVCSCVSLSSVECLCGATSTDG